MKKTKHEIVAQIIGASVFCSTLLAYKVLFYAVRFNPSWIAILMLILALSQFAFSLAGSIGLMKFRRWGFIAMYASFLVTFFGLSIAYVPFILKILPVQARGYGLLALNTLIIIILIVIHVIEEKSKKFGTDGANQVSDATLEPAPGATSSAHQG